MANFTLIRPLGWDFLSALASTEMETIDERLVQCIHADGGTWNPTAPIVIGGAQGMSISAPFTLAGGSWPLLSSRTVSKEDVPRVMACTHVDNLPTAYAEVIDGVLEPAAYLRPMAGSGRYVHLAIPGIAQMVGQSLTRVSIGQRYTAVGDSPGTLTGPRYRVFRRDFNNSPSGSTITALSAVVNGSTVNWATLNAESVQLIDLTVPEVISSDYEYYLQVEQPWNATTPASLWLPKIYATYTATSMRLG